VIITVGFERNLDDPREWIEAAAPTHPSLVDTTWTVADLYNVVNVPTVFWIDETGHLVRPGETAFGSNMFQEFTGVDATEHHALLRAWVRGESPPPERESMRAYQDLPTDADQQARAEFGLGRWLWEQGHGDAATAHFAEGERLAPGQWTIWRGSMRMQGLEPMGGPEFMTKMTAYIERGGRMNKIIPG
jgi:hypothetical protein